MCWLLSPAFFAQRVVAYARDDLSSQNLAHDPNELFSKKFVCLPSSRGAASIHRVAEKAHSRKPSFVLCRDLRTARSIGYTGQACSASFREEFFSETGLPTNNVLGNSGYKREFWKASTGPKNRSARHQGGAPCPILAMKVGKNRGVEVVFALLQNSL